MTGDAFYFYYVYNKSVFFSEFFLVWDTINCKLDICLILCFFSQVVRNLG